MASVILVCGLNGAGKSTMAKALAHEIGYRFVDMEDVYYSKEDNPDYPYEKPRSYEKSVALLLDIFEKENNVVLASVTGNFGKEVMEQINCAVYIEVPKDIRIKRVYERSYERFGEKIREGREYYKQVKAFHEFVLSRDENLVENWLSTLSCPVLKVDGTLPVQENVKLLAEKLCNGEENK